MHVTPKDGGNVQTLDDLNPMYYVTETTMPKTLANNRKKIEYYIFNVRKFGPMIRTDGLPGKCSIFQ